MSRHQHVVELEVIDVLDAWFGQFQTDVPGHGTADDGGDKGNQNVERPDVFVVGGTEPAGEEPRHVMVVIVVVGFRGIGHSITLLDKYLMTFRLRGRYLAVAACARRTGASFFCVSLVANSFFALASQLLNSVFGSALMWIGIKLWLTPHNSEHMP